MKREERVNINELFEMSHLYCKPGLKKKSRPHREVLFQIIYDHTVLFILVQGTCVTWWCHTQDVPLFGPHGLFLYRPPVESRIENIRRDLKGLNQVFFRVVGTVLFNGWIFTPYRVALHKFFAWARGLGKGRATKSNLVWKYKNTIPLFRLSYLI